MKRLAMVALAVTTFAHLGACASAAELKDVVSGTKYPLTMPLKQLDASWLHVRVGGSGQEGPLAFFSTMASATAGIYYTHGETVHLGDQVFMIAYRPQQQPMQALATLRGRRDGAPPLTGDSTLELALVNMRAVDSLSEIRAFALEREIEESQRLAEQIAEMTTELTDSSEEATSEGNLKQLALAVLMYAQDYDVLPPMEDAATFEDELAPYVRSTELFRRPDTDEAYGINASLSGKALADLEKPEQMVVLYETTPAEDGSRAAAFLDGHVTRVSGEEWERLKSASSIP